MKPRIAFFDTKPYDIESLNAINSNYGFELKYFKYHLNPDNIVLARGFNVAVVFVNDIIDAEMIDKLIGFGVKLIAPCSSGYNNIDLKAAKNNITIVRVPAHIRRTPLQNTRSP